MPILMNVGAKTNFFKAVTTIMTKKPLMLGSPVESIVFFGSLGFMEVGREPGFSLYGQFRNLIDIVSYSMYKDELNLIYVFSKGSCWKSIFYSI